MIVYKDIVSGDELFSDSYKMQLIDDLIYEVEGKVISVSGDIDEALIGGNKATEPTEDGDDGDTGVDPNVVTGINIVLTHKLQSVPYDKTSFKEWLKTYMKNIKGKVEEKNPARVDLFQKGMQKWAVDILKNFDKFQFYTGEQMDSDGMVIAMGYRSDEVTPYFIFIKDGIQEEKY
jgi:hypothetical protein